MAKKEKRYHRLTRPRSGLGTYDSLWRGKDHLLVVSSSGFSESYYRFFLRDIQAFLVRPSKRYFYFNLIGGCIAGLSLMPLLADLVTNKSMEAAIADWIGFAFLFVPSFLVLVVNLIKGPSCVVSVSTALQTKELRPVGRRRTWRRVRAKIEPLIQEAQAALVSAAQVPAEPVEVPPMPDPTPTPTPTPTVIPNSDDDSADNGGAASPPPPPA
ncbi:hypothetical protein [Actomonas aquatica]|uniref:Uncharacterized protein n=1 Tax=Actomonas aquatica TaxID=2866162 RepID=A0ABZ1C5C8_9BACT|nr:hypothetical protein [Opitutus sp. WL0086]WRQ86597.1 hypothetical protein K1X11_017435 [Opitutus sp. WL0086]